MAPNINSMSMSRHLSLLDLTGPSMARTQSFHAVSRGMSDVDLQSLGLVSGIPADAGLDRVVGKNQVVAAPSSDDYWGWDSDDNSNSAETPLASEPFESTPRIDSPPSALASYWDWPSDDVQIESEPAEDILSLANIEANLVQAANALNAETGASPALVESHDDYWAEASLNTQGAAIPAVALAPQHKQLSYWDWPTTTQAQDKQAKIEALVQHEAARKLLSVGAIERSLRFESAKQQHRLCSPTSKSSEDYWAWESAEVAQSSRLHDPTHPDYDYWTWTGAQSRETAASDESSGRSSAVAALLAYEHARVLLSADRVEQQLQQQTSCAPTSEVVRAEIDTNEAYWDMPNESLGDAYWDERPKPAALAAVGDSYWDW